MLQLTAGVLASQDLGFRMIECDRDENLGFRGYGANLEVCENFSILNVQGRDLDANFGDWNFLSKSASSLGDRFLQTPRSRPPPSAAYRDHSLRANDQRIDFAARLVREMKMDRAIPGRPNNPHAPRARSTVLREWVAQCQELSGMHLLADNRNNLRT